MPSQPVPLAHLLDALEPLTIATRHVYNVPVTGVAFDSRHVNRGDIFVAIPGFKQDGHAFIPQALEKGAAALVTEREVSAPGVPVVRVKNARRALAILACHFFAHPSRELKVCGITGTNGKTTATTMLHAILAASGSGCGLIGTVEVITGQQRLPARLTTPEAPEIQAYLREMLATGLRYAVMEVSAQGVELERVTGIAFSMGGITNVTTDHLDFYPSPTAYIHTKGRFLAMVPPDKPVLVNADDPLSLTLARAYHPGSIITYAVDYPADVTADRLVLGRRGMSFDLTVHHPLPRPAGGLCGPLRLAVKVPLLGKQNAYNALLAATAALIAGVTPHTVTHALRSFRGVDRRMQVFRAGALTIVDDTALNPASIDAVLATIRETLGSHKVTIVYAIRGGRGPEINRRNAVILASWLGRFPGGRLISTSSSGNVGPNDTVTREEEETFHATLRRYGIRFNHFAALPVAIAAGLDAARPDGILLLLGAQGVDDGARIVFDLLNAEKNIATPEIAFPARVASPTG